MTEEERDELVKYRIQKAEDTIKEIEPLTQQGFYNTAVNRLYYSCFYAVTALLVHHEIGTTTHSGVRNKFGHYFIKKGVISQKIGKAYSKLFNMRLTSDYGDFFDYAEEDVVDMLPDAQELIMEIKNLIISSK